LAKSAEAAWPDYCGCDGDCREANERELAATDEDTSEQKSEKMPNGGVRYTYLPNESEAQGGVSDETELNAAVEFDNQGNEVVPSPEDLVKELDAEDKQESLKRRAYGRYDQVEDADLANDAAEDELAVGGFLEKTWNEITNSVKASMKKMSQKTGASKVKHSEQEESATKATKPAAAVPEWTDADSQSGLEERTPEAAETKTATEETTKELPEEAVGRLSGKNRIQPKLYNEINDNEGVPFGVH